MPIATDVDNRCSIGRGQELVHDEIREQPRSDVIRSKLAFQPVRGLRIIARHDTCVMYEHINR